MKTEEKKLRAIELREITADLIAGPNKLKNRYQQILESLARRNYYRLHSIIILSEDAFTGDSIADLSRGMLEDMINIEFINLKGKDKMSQQFYNYIFVDQKINLDFILSSGAKPDPDFEKTTLEDYSKVEKEFDTRRNIALAKTPGGKHK